MQKTMGSLQMAAVRFVESLKAEDEEIVLSFGGMVKELAPLAQDKKRLPEAINRTVAEGATLLYDGIVRGFYKLEAAKGRRAIVLITDGADTASLLSVESVVKMSGRLAVPIFVIGMGDALKERTLKNILEDMAERTGGKTFFIDKTQDMVKAFDEVSANLKASYRAGYYLSKPADRKWRKISVTLKSSKGEVITRQGYYANKMLVEKTHDRN
jgi:Ca-activated chloride channel family protein